MSRITIEGQLNGQPLPVVIGWDRRLQNCFVQFELTEEQADDPAFDAVSAESMAVAFADLTYDEVLQSVSRSGVNVPAAAFDELSSHISRNAGNTIVSFAQDGARTVVLAD